MELASATSNRINHVLGPALADELEDISSIARTVMQVAPGALQGAAKGFLVAGPAGAAVGALGGGLASSGVLGGGAPAKTAPQQPVQAVANPAALQLLLTLLRPEIVEALIAMVLGRNGARGVEIAGQAVPTAAVTNLIQSLAEAASATHHASRPHVGVPRYLADARGRGEDISSPEVRARSMLGLIHEAWEDDLDDQLEEELDDELDEDIDEALDAEDIYPGELER
ncbi:MAG: hypothetical protein WKG01_13965 [Kofleriaceae bacterium]